jgi:hypothetical protein
MVVAVVVLAALVQGISIQNLQKPTAGSSCFVLCCHCPAGAQLAVMGAKAVGAHISVWWPLDESWYSGEVGRRGEGGCHMRRPPAFNLA